MKTFSENIIFWDSEFSSLNPYKGEILSMGFVKPSGEELYIELEHEGEVDPWVKENVLPYLSDKKISRGEAIDQMNRFVGKDYPFMVTYVSMYDTIYLYKLIKIKNDTKQLPFHWIPVDFASTLFAYGIDPAVIANDEAGFCMQLGIDLTNHRKHHALDDAKLLKEMYNKIVNR